MEQKKLWDELSKGVLKNLYLLYGEERFLVEFYATSIVKTAVSQDPDILKDVFEGNAPVNEIIGAAMTLPFLASKRIVYVKDSKLFAAGRKADSETMADFLGEIPEESILIFVETEVDKRLKIFKQASELGRVVDCEAQTTGALIKWIGRIMKEKGKTMDSQTANVLLSTCGREMSKLYTELDKLAHYSGERREITANDIREICSPTLEARIFSLTKAMGEGNISEALKHYNIMLHLKESPVVILTMIIRQLRIILLVKCGTQKKLPSHQIAKDVGIRDFVIHEALSHGRRFTKERLIESLKKSQETDVKIKTGLLTPEIGVEMLLIEVTG